ncbi:hypothetical protein LTR47_011625 [Exophiala xenobiotica]|nr:hypothetical protein LTR72_011657 [Exophiala xenobiotica]KAK5218869.1 hypothetical protein LTR47_011625 [Exophiala xenobiotica]KAK5243335.1 hypothetical protein LTS06_010879 [Exophiala xenobiotica]KAK5260188.1 hypothetical protein LTR40_004607 [Exophiala xenobiotica]KAK5284708.1 hypothetical protein LTR14_011555 [Exophiala xenobiotica]
MSWSTLNPEQLSLRLQSLNLQLDRQLRTVICLTCGYAVTPRANGVNRHLGEKHQIPPAARRGLSNFLSPLGIRDPRDLSNQPDYSTPRMSLRVQRGVACRKCPYRTLSLKLLSDHLHHQHDVVHTHSTWKRDYIHENVALQSWTLNPPQGYWIVVPPKDIKAPSLDETSPPISPRRQSHIDSLYRNERAHPTIPAPSQALNTDLEPVDTVFLSNWMQRTGWNRTYRHAHRDLLECRDNEDDEEEDDLTSDSDVDVESEEGENIDLEEQDSDEDEDEDELDTVTSHDLASEGDEDEDQLEDRQIGNTTSTSLDILASYLARLSIALISEEFIDGRPTTTLLVYYSGILGFSSDGLTFLRPRNYTGKMSALVFYMRLLILERTLPRFQYVYVKWPQRPRQHQLQRLNRLRRRLPC